MTSLGNRTTPPDPPAAKNQQFNVETGQWEPALPIRRATWLEALLDRWIGPTTGDPWRSVFKGLMRRA